MNEEKLIQAARQLGARAADRIDVETTARKVVERLREQPVRRTTWIHQSWVRIAAMVVVLVGGVLWFAPGHGPGARQDGAHFVADDLRDLSTDELRSLLSSFDQILDENVVPDSTADLPELDTQQLRELLREG